MSQGALVRRRLARGGYSSWVGRHFGLVLIVVCTACSSVVPGPETGIPVTITNGDDQPAAIEVTLYNAVTGQERTTVEPFDLAPGDTTTIRLEPTRERDDAFHVIVNGFVAVSSDFAGCAVGAIEDPLPEELDIVVLPNGEPDACS